MAFRYTLTILRKNKTDRQTCKHADRNISPTYGGRSNIITVTASSRKRNVTVRRSSVCLSVCPVGILTVTYQEGAADDAASIYFGPTMRRTDILVIVATQMDKFEQYASMRSHLVVVVFFWILSLNQSDKTFSLSLAKFFAHSNSITLTDLHVYASQIFRPWLK